MDAGVSDVKRVEMCRVDDVATRRSLGMRVAGSMAFFAADVPLGHLFGEWLPSQSGLVGRVALPPG